MFLLTPHTLFDNKSSKIYFRHCKWNIFKGSKQLFFDQSIYWLLKNFFIPQYRHQSQKIHISGVLRYCCDILYQSKWNQSTSSPGQQESMGQHERKGTEVWFSTLFRVLKGGREAPAPFMKQWKERLSLVPEFVQRYDNTEVNLNMDIYEYYYQNHL